jgi:hypothetical protein
MKKLLLLISLIVISVATMVGQPYNRPVTVNPRSGYVNINELTCAYGLGITTPDYSKYFYGLTTTHGYQLNLYGLHVNSSLIGGIGTGILFYNGGTLFPLYADVRYTTNKKRVSPFIFATGGFLISLDDLNYKTRLFVNGGGGVRFKFDDHISIVVGPGLFVQMGNGVFRDAFVNMKVGIVFKPG